MLANLSTPVVLMIWFVATIPFKNTFLASPRASNLTHFQHVLSTSFKVYFVIRFNVFGFLSSSMFKKLHATNSGFSWKSIGGNPRGVGQVPKPEFGSSFSQLGGSLVSFLLIFRSLEAPGRRWGPTLDGQKRFGRPKVHQEAPPPKYPHLLGLFFEYFLIFWHLFLSIVFCWVSGLFCHTFLFHFDTTLWHVFILVRASGFSDFLQPFYSKTRF